MTWACERALTALAVLWVLVILAGWWWCRKRRPKDWGSE